MEGREERSKGIEIRINDVFVIIKPTTPFKLAKHEALRKRNWSMNVQEQETNKFIIQASCSVHG
jgi:hypothetical protein